MMALSYPSSMRHLQELIMASESCAKNWGKKSFFGKDKYAEAHEKFVGTVARCSAALYQDGKISNQNDARCCYDAIHKAMKLMSTIYTSWPLGFVFWGDYYEEMTR